MACFTTTEDLQKCRATTRTLHNCRAEVPCKRQSQSTIQRTLHNCRAEVPCKHQSLSAIRWTLHGSYAGSSELRSVIGACTAVLQGPLLLHGSSVEVPCKHQSLSTNQQFGRANEVHSKRELGPLLYLSDMKTYDAFARMKNMDTVKQLAAPKSS